MREPQSVFSEALIVARYEIVSMILSVRALMFVVVYGIAAGGAGWFFLFLDEKTNGQLTNMHAMASANREEIIKQAQEQGMPTALLDAMLSGDIPVLVLTVLFFSTFVIPGLIVLIGYSSIGEDLHTRFARYVLQRVRRGSFLAGKIAAHFAVSLGAVIVVHVILFCIAMTLDRFDSDKTLAALPRLWLGMGIFTLGYVAFTSMFSALIKPPFAALAVGGMALAVMWVISKFPGVRDIWMGAVDQQLWVLDPKAIGLYLGHAVLFVGIAWFGLQRRDV